MDIKQDIDNLDEALWLPDIITTLTKHGVDHPLFDILVLLKSNTNPCVYNELNRLIENVIVQTLLQLNSVEYTKFKKDIADLVEKSKQPKPQTDKQIEELLRNYTKPIDRLNVYGHIKPWEIKQIEKFVKLLRNKIHEISWVQFKRIWKKVNITYTEGCTLCYFVTMVEFIEHTKDLPADLYSYVVICNRRLECEKSK